MKDKNEILCVTTNEVSGEDIAATLGYVVGIGNVAFGPFTATKARQATEKAFRDLGRQLIEMKADAVVGVQTTATSGALIFFRPHTVFISGTAVQFKKK
jgi:uncharacterized protein YbjQ (UPF0145 family)